MQTVRLRYTITADGHPPDFPAGAAEIMVRSVNVPEAVEGSAQKQARDDLKALFVLLEALPPIGWIREGIDRQIQEERDSWER